MLKGISTLDTCFLTISIHVFKTVHKEKCPQRTYRFYKKQSDLIETHSDITLLINSVRFSVNYKIFV